MSELQSFIENIATTNELNTKEKAFIEKADKADESKLIGRKSYTHKDGTKVIVATFNPTRIDGKGVEVIFIRNDDYVRFCTIGEGMLHDSRIKISFGNINDNKPASEKSFPIEAIMNDEDIMDSLEKNLPTLAKTYKKYVPLKIYDTMGAIIDIEASKNNDIKFKTALDKWNGGKGI